jgi:uncharacterized RDD family membrane protein YckC
MALGFAEPVTPAAAAPAADTMAAPRSDERLEFDSLSLAPAPTPEPDLDLSFTVGGTPLGGDVRSGGGSVILPGRAASSSASAGFARVRPGDAIAEPAAAPERDAVTEPATLPAVILSRADATAETAAALDRHASAAADAEPDGAAAPLGPRMLAGLVDLAVLLAVDAAIVFATLRATGVDVVDVQRLPLAPLAVFLVVLAVGYLAMSTVLAGRTFGKAAFGLSVVESGGRPVRLAPAVVRALIQVLTVPAAGIGFLPALLGADRRSLYDRLAGTDVVRASRPTEDTRAQ